MALVYLKPEKVEITADVGCAIHSRPPQAVNTPGGLYPMYARAFEMDDWRLRQGWPVSIPGHDVRQKTLISCTGEVLADRESPISLTTGAALRWVADEGTWDETTLQWAPTQTSGSYVSWSATPGHEPVLVDYEYRVDDERFYGKALNFDSDEKNYLYTNFSGSLGGSSGYTIIMVMSPNSTYGNDLSVPYNGLWCPQDKGVPYVEVQMQGRYLFHATEASDRLRAISVNSALDDTAPFYVAVVFDRPYTTYYVGTGPTQPRVETVPSGPTAVPLNMDLFLGSSTEDEDHTMDMALLDLGIYADKLNGAQVVNEFSILSQAYGGA